MAESAFSVHVPEAEPLVGGLRLQYDESARLGVPAHVTVLYPFMDPLHINSEVVQRCAGVIKGHQPFRFQLRSVGRFAATAYLAPEPPDPFIALTEALVKEFPAFPPFRAEFPTVIPHLTVAHGSTADAEHVESDLVTGLRSVGAVESVCTSVVLMENSSGHWRSMHVFPLASAPSI